MVVDSETLKPLHALTDEGEELYRDFLEKEADKILYKSEHPFRYLFEKIKELFS